MDNWHRITVAMSNLFESNKELNFGITLTPEQVTEYMLNKVIFVRFTDAIEAAVFITNDGECGFIASNKLTHSGYRFLTDEFTKFAQSLPDNLRTHLWCRIQNNNPVVKRLVRRLGFVKDRETDFATYYKYGG